MWKGKGGRGVNWGGRSRPKSIKLDQMSILLSKGKKGPNFVYLFRMFKICVPIFLILRQKISPAWTGNVRGIIPRILFYSIIGTKSFSPYKALSVLTTIVF